MKTHILDFIREMVVAYDKEPDDLETMDKLISGCKEFLTKEDNVEWAEFERGRKEAKLAMLSHVENYAIAAKEIKNPNSFTKGYLSATEEVKVILTK